jgi:hypothetical protein
METRVAFWTAPRPWKGKACNIILINEARAHLWLATDAFDPVTYSGPGHEFFPDYLVFDPAADPKLLSLNANCANVHTDSRYADETASMAHAGFRLMGEGVMSGLEERRDHLPGRFIVCKAIGLAVHLGASVINLYGEVPPRAARNLDTMRRPLKGHRVRLNILGE